MHISNKDAYRVKGWPKAIPFFLSAFLLLTSCSEDDGTTDEYADWQSRNETFFAERYATAKANSDGTWRTYLNWTLDGQQPYPSGKGSITYKSTDYIAVQVLKSGTGTESPLITDSVRVHYRGRLIPTTSHSEGYVFDQSYKGTLDTKTALPKGFYANQVIDGWTTALLKMHIGDTWRIYVPAALGYGSVPKTGIPAYSTLVFDITLNSFYRKTASSSKKTKK